MSSGGLRPADPSEALSTISVVLPTLQPLLSPPMRALSATRASSMNTSLNRARPVISVRGRTSTPGWSMAKANHEMPACLGWSGSVRASSMPMSETWPPEVHTFWPVITHSSPSRSARHWRLARSEPALGSLNSWHHPTRPSRISGTYRSTCSGVPCMAIVGAASMRPSPPGGPSTPRSASTSDTSAAWSMPYPSPPADSGSIGWE